MKTTIVVCVLLIIFSLTTSANVGGHVAADYDLITHVWNWEVETYKEIFKGFRLGFTMITYAPGVNYKLGIPSWIPHRLDYDVWGEYRVGSFTIRLSDWCNHWFSQSGVLQDEWGLKVRVKYEY